MRLFSAFYIIFLFGSAYAQIRPTAGPFGHMPKDNLYIEPYNRLTTMNAKFGYLSSVLTDRLNLCGFQSNPLQSSDLVATYYQLKFRGITEPFNSQCRSLDCIWTKELSYILNDLDANPQSVPYLIKSYKIEKSVAEDLLRTFLNISKNSN
jgi:hypothetical protein